MYKIDSTGSTANNEFRNANSTANGTIVDAQWMTTVQRELEEVITQGGLTLTKYVEDQLYNAILNLIANNSTSSITEATDSDIISPNDNDILGYNSGNSTWINQTTTELGIDQLIANNKLRVYDTSNTELTYGDL